MKKDSEAHNRRVPGSGKLKYWAFISYSHADESWAAWLHSGIERFSIPSSLVGRKTRFGELPKRLFPVFRDRAELAGSPSLSEGIQEALRQSLYLVVICSPQAAKSREVEKEIKYFKSLGREDLVLCMVVDGEPNASDQAGDDPQEAFPAAVRFAIGVDGVLTKVKAEPPLAADARREGDGRKNAKLKLIAGMLGVGFDELKRRDQRRRRIQSVQLAGVTTVVVVVLVGVWLFFSGQAKREAWFAKRDEMARFAAQSNVALGEGRPVDAAKLALAAWPRRRGDEPQVTAALSALGNALPAMRELHRLDVQSRHLVDRIKDEPIRL